MSRGVRLVTFDAFNTLFHVSPSPGEIYARLARQHGLEVDTRVLKAAFSQAYKAHNEALPNFGAMHSVSAKDWWKAVVYETFGSASRPSRLPMRDFEPVFEDIYTHFSLPIAFQLYPETLEVLDKLKSRNSIKLGVISNSDRRTVQVIDGLGLGKYFDFIITSHEARVAKPDRRIFDEALILGNAQSNQALHIGENYELDYLGARDAGWHALWLNRGDESTGADDFLQ